tara:strand:+ start:526 stop:798 length:273 start_codon:yes stop_codon:yes gene_type:complete
MQIKLGDIITDNRGRVGELINIGIAVRKEDIAAEDDTSLSAKEYDTDLGYTGAVTFGGSNWCYFDQIKEVTTKEDSDVDVAINMENEWWK